MPPPFCRRQVGPHLFEARERVFELASSTCSRDSAVCAGGEDVENELASIEYLDPDGFLEVAGLRGGEVVVEDDDVGVVALNEVGQFLHFPRADIGGELNVVPLLR